MMLTEVISSIGEACVLPQSLATLWSSWDHSADGRGVHYG